jgi:hypothetical protein
MLAVTDHCTRADLDVVRYMCSEFDRGPGAHPYVASRSHPRRKAGEIFDDVVVIDGGGTVHDATIFTDLR